PVRASEVPAFVAGADISAVMIEGVSKNNELSLPNKFFESVAGGAAVVARPRVELQRFVQKYSVGVCTDARTAEEFFDACRAACAIPPEVLVAGRRRLLAEHGWPVQRRKIELVFQKARLSAEKL